VNFNVYPNWWGDDRILVMSIAQAREIGILVVRPASNGSNSGPSFNALTSKIPMASPSAAMAGARQIRASWKVPDVDPCILVTKAEAEAVMGLLSEGPKLGGSALDGTVCAYVGTIPLVVSIGVISTAAFELQKSDPGITTITDLGDEAYITRPDSFKDIHLFVRKGRAAVMVTASIWPGDAPETQRSEIAKSLAAKALDRLLNQSI
jgi:hypothetical protein